MKALVLVILATISLAVYAQNCTTICSDVGGSQVCSTFCR